MIHLTVKTTPNGSGVVFFYCPNNGTRFEKLPKSCPKGTGYCRKCSICCRKCSICCRKRGQVTVAKGTGYCRTQNFEPFIFSTSEAVKKLILLALYYKNVTISKKATISSCHIGNSLVNSNQLPKRRQKGGHNERLNKVN